IVNQLHAEYFWRDPYKNEVDVILSDKKPKPVEIKYGRVETKGIRKFMEKFHVNKGYLISLNQEKNLEFSEGKIIVTPAYKFLLKQNQ
ncbi:MAG: hypothetical protein DRN09_03305, partial [Thermoplasmata archaeon]